MTVTAPRFTLADADLAYDEWGMNCGPSALAAMVGLTLDEVRPHMGDFESKHYTNPTLMIAALRSTHTVFRITKLGDKTAGAVCTFRGLPRYGLARIQWEGPWTMPGVPMRVRYRFTHWVGAVHKGSDLGIFDVNCMNNGTGWCRYEDWRDTVVPHIIQQYPRANGGWHVTHAVEIEKDAKVLPTVPGEPDLEVSSL